MTDECFESPTDWERREIAFEILVRRSEELQFSYREVSSVIGIERKKYEDRRKFDRDAWKRLAELIYPESERTCKREKLYDAGGKWYEGCSKCKNPLSECDMFCSKCGSRVVE